jgi:diadenosine tetraphosphatase ApaH/serine/threonine PP2A family protein phosphatase
LIIALLSDIHANIGALEACLAHAREHGAERFVFLGDLVGYGADPQSVVEIVEHYCAQGAVAVKGNHDEAVEKNVSYMNESAKAAIDWAREMLNGPQQRFLAALPLLVRDNDMCFVHASADFPQRWNYIDSASAARKSADAAQTTYSFCGHMHEQQLYFQAADGKMIPFRPIPGTSIPVRRHRRWLAIVGSAGQPSGGSAAAAYTIFDRDREQITFFRVPYDHSSAAARIRQAGLPESLAYRFEAGA